MDRVPYDNDPRPLAPANRNLSTLPRADGPNPTQDGPESGTPAVDLFPYLDTGKPEYGYLRGAKVTG